DAKTPFAKLSKKQRDLLLQGPSKDAKEPDVAPAKGKKSKKAAEPDPFGKDFEGVLPNLRRRFEEGSWTVQEELDPYRALRECPACHGNRLRPESLAVTVKGRTIADCVNLPISEALALFDGLELQDREAIIATRILKEIRDRL